MKPDEPRAQQLKSLLHETAHYYSEAVFAIPRADAETIAESAAFVVGARFGFDTGTRSFPYVALWAKEKKVLERNLLGIRSVSVRLVGALEGVALMHSPAKGGSAMDREEAERIAEAAAVGAAFLVGSRMAEEVAKAMAEENLHHSPVSPHCEAVLEALEKGEIKCWDFRRTRSAVMCAAFKMMEDEKLAKLPVSRGWQHVRTKCRVD